MTSDRKVFIHLLPVGTQANAFFCPHGIGRNGTGMIGVVAVVVAAVVAVVHILAAVASSA
jgi:hypothetical protein